VLIQQCHYIYSRQIESQQYVGNRSRSILMYGTGTCLQMLITVFFFYVFYLTTLSIPTIIKGQ